MARWSLICHPDTPTAVVTAVTAAVERDVAGVLNLRFDLAGEVERLCIPGEAEPVLRHGLWEHTCFEAFVGLPAADEYWELNLSPSRQWAVYHFSNYREPAGIGGDDVAPQIRTTIGPGLLQLEAQVALARLLPQAAAGPIRIGLSAVAEDVDGRLSYWALRHPPGKADFHHASCFVRG